MPQGVLAVLLAGGLLAGCEHEQPQRQAEIRPVRAETVQLVAIDAEQRYAAVIRPRIEADLGFRVAGKLVARLVEVGSRVEAGTVLARLDPADLELQTRAVAAQLASAQAEADNAKADFSRYAQLRQGEWATRQEYDRRKSIAASAEARLSEIAAQLRVSRNSLNYAALVADGPGVITAVLAEPGQVVAQGQAVFKLAREGALEAVANIPEQRMGELDGSRMSVELWADPAHPLAATLREISPAADAATRTYQVRNTLVEPPATVRIGMTATLVVRRADPRPVARLPMTALTQQGQAPAVWVLNATGDGAQLRAVQVAAFAGDQVVIREGLQGGERVVTAGVQKLDAGQKLRVWVEPAR